MTLPSWLPRISLPQPLQDAARRAGNLAISTAKDVAAKRRAETASGVAAQVEEYPGSPTPANSLAWVLGGAAILAVAVVASRKR